MKLQQIQITEEEYRILKEAHAILQTRMSMESLDFNYIYLNDASNALKRLSRRLTLGQ